GSSLGQHASGGGADPLPPPVTSTRAGSTRTSSTKRLAGSRAARHPSYAQCGALRRAAAAPLAYDSRRSEALRVDKLSNQFAEDRDVSVDLALLMSNGESPLLRPGARREQASVHGVQPRHSDQRGVLRALQGCQVDDARLSKRDTAARARAKRIAWRAPALQNATTAISQPGRQACQMRV